jgi:hypothetical protein
MMEFTDPFVQEAERQTQQEIFDDVFDDTPKKPDPHALTKEEEEEGIDPADDAAQVRGWNDRVLSDTEQFHTNLYGHGINNMDRHVELDEELSYKDKYERADAELQQYRGQQALRDEPERQRQLYEQREALKADMQINTDRYVDERMQMYQQNAAMHQQQVDQSFEAAQVGDPEGFDEAYGTLMSGIKEGDPISHRAGQYIYSRGPKAGAELMSWHAAGGQARAAYRATRSLSDVGSYHNMPRGLAADRRDPEDMFTSTIDSWIDKDDGIFEHATRR